LGFYLPSTGHALSLGCVDIYEPQLTDDSFFPQETTSQEPLGTSLPSYQVEAGFKSFCSPLWWVNLSYTCEEGGFEEFDFPSNLNFF
jgi:hypothetical protein